MHQQSPPPPPHLPAPTGGARLPWSPRTTEFTTERIGAFTVTPRAVRYMADILTADAGRGEGRGRGGKRKCKRDEQTSCVYRPRERSEETKAPRELERFDMISLLRNSSIPPSSLPLVFPVRNNPFSPPL